MTRFEALELAASQELDLIEVSPMAEPPVCRIIDFGKFQFEQNKKTALAKKKQKDIKNFLEVDPYLTKTAHFEAARDELNKIKGKNDGINNHRGNYHKKQQMLERKKKA